MKSYIEKVFLDWEHVNVLIVGDVMIDRYVRGSVGRISPEAPVPVLEMENEENRLGGAANVALNIRALGANPFLCSVIGMDANAETFLQLMPGEDLPSRYIIQSKDRITTTKTRVMAGGQHLLRIDREDTHDLTLYEEGLFLKNIVDLLENGRIDVVLFQDYNKGVLSLGMIRQIMLEAGKRDIPTVVDPKKKNFLAFKGCTLFKPNLKEIRESLPFRVEPTEASLGKAAAFLREELGNRYTVITLSERGLYAAGGESGQIIPTQPRNIADVCGAGDTVVSIVALGLASGMDLAMTAKLANLAGGQVCEKAGVVPVNREQLLTEFVSTGHRYTWDH